MTPLSTAQQQRIANNIFAACENIQNLNATGYKFLNQCGGFIAHYDMDGFKAFYSPHGSLVRDIYRNESINQYANYRAGERFADYYHSKRDTYNLVMHKLRERVDLVMNQAVRRTPSLSGVQYG